MVSIPDNWQTQWTHITRKEKGTRFLLQKAKKNEDELHSLYKAREKNKTQGSSVSQSQKEKQMSTQSGQCAWTLQKHANVTPVNRATSNHLTSMVQTVLYRRCMETTLPCSPYCTCIRYGSDAPTARKKAITKFIMVQSQTTRQQCSNSHGARQWYSKKLRGKGRRKTRKFEEGSGDQCGVCKTNECDTMMDATWAASHCRTSMVRMIV